MSLLIVPIVGSAAGLLAAEGGLLPQAGRGRASSRLLLGGLWLLLVASTAAALARSYDQSVGRAAAALVPALMVSARVAWERTAPVWATPAIVALCFASAVATASWLALRPAPPRRITSLAAHL